MEVTGKGKYGRGMRKVWRVQVLELREEVVRGSIGGKSRGREVGEVKRKEERGWNTMGIRGKEG